MTVDAEPRLTHVDENDRPRMVDVSDKSPTSRIARATARVSLAPSTVAALRADTGPKGSVLTVSRLAGIMAAKRTSDLVPFCHPLRLDDVDVAIAIEDAGVVITTEVRARDVTGVEMEALTAAAVAAVTVYDMVKAIDRGAVIGDLHVTYKSGGRSGEWSAPSEARR